MRRFLPLFLAALFLLLGTPANAVVPHSTTYQKIGTVFQDAHYGGLSHDLYVVYQGDCDSSGYRVPMPNTGGPAWAQIASSFKGSSAMPQCNWVALHAWRGPKKDQWWTGPLPVDHLGDWNDNIDVAQFYAHCICQPARAK